MRACSRTIVVAVALTAGAVAGFGLAPRVEAASGCGSEDRPETAVPGDVPLRDQISERADEGYSYGLSLGDYSSLGGRGGRSRR